jgi:hypothetical protein
MAGALGVAAIVQAALAWKGSFDIDEWQHLHASRLIGLGRLPYRDFFEHHMPGLWYLLAPSMAWAQPELDPGRAVAFLHGVRLSFLAVWAATLFLTWRLARAHAASGRAVSVATVLLAFTPMFVDKVGEVRPDGIAVCLVLLAWIALIGGIRERAVSRFLAAGLLLGASACFTQKALMAVPAVLVCLALHAWDGGAARVRSGVVLGIGLLLPVLAILALFASAGSTATFVESNLWLNLRWVRVVPRLFAFWTFARESPFLLVAGMAGFAMALRSLRDREARARGRYVVPLALAGFSAVMLVSPAPWPQYLLNHMPLLAILGAEAVVRGAERWARRPEWAWAAVLALGVLPGLVVTLTTSRSNAEQLRGVRYVQTITRPADTVLDGATGYGVFRPNAFFYAHVNWDIRGMIPGDRRAELEDGLASGRIAPEVVLLDDEIAYMSRKVTEYVRTNYRPGGMPDVWLRTPRAKEPRPSRRAPCRERTSRRPSSRRRR